MARTVWITGTEGFLGRAAAAAFDAAGWRVVGLSRHSQPGGDLADLRVLSKLAEHGPADAVIHLASRVDLRQDAKEDELYGSNVLAAAVLADCARRWGARMILASSISVFGARQAITGTSAVQPATPYGHAKAAAEAVVRASGAAHTILRIGGIYGFGGPAHLGLNTALTDAVTAGRPPRLVGPGNGLRNYVYVHDLATMIVDAADRGVDGTHLVGGPEPVSLRAMLSAIADRFCDGALETLDGPDAVNCIVETSSALAAGRSFTETLLDIRHRHEPISAGSLT